MARIINHCLKFKKKKNKVQTPINASETALVPHLCQKKVKLLLNKPIVPTTFGTFLGSFIRDDLKTVT